MTPNGNETGSLGTFRNPLRRKIRAGEQALGMLVTLEAPSVSEVAALMGLDWVMIDMEHGATSFRDVLNHLRALQGSETAGLVRLASNSVDNIKRVLDVGAHGVFVPLVRQAAELEDSFKWARYPLRGERGMGADRALRWGLAAKQYLEVANEETLVIPIIETLGAIQDFEAITAVDGLEAIFYGPGDLSQSMGYGGSWDAPQVENAVRETSRIAASRGIATGVICRSPAEADCRRKQGFQMLGLGTDIKLMIERIRHIREAMQSSGEGAPGTSRGEVHPG